MEGPVGTGVGIAIIIGNIDDEMMMKQYKKVIGANKVRPPTGRSDRFLYNLHDFAWIAQPFGNTIAHFNGGFDMSASHRIASHRIAAQRSAALSRFHDGDDATSSYLHHDNNGSIIALTRPTAICHRQLNVQRYTACPALQHTRCRVPIVVGHYELPSFSPSPP
jgi:hypothetical protein